MAMTCPRCGSTLFGRALRCFKCHEPITTPEETSSGFNDWLALAAKGDPKAVHGLLMAARRPELAARAVSALQRFLEGAANIVTIDDLLDSATLVDIKEVWTEPCGPYDSTTFERPLDTQRLRELARAEIAKRGA